MCGIGIWGPEFSGGGIFLVTVRNKPQKSLSTHCMESRCLAIMQHSQGTTVHNEYGFDIAQELAKAHRNMIKPIHLIRPCDSSIKREIKTAKDELRGAHSAVLQLMDMPLPLPFSIRVR